MTDSAVSRHNDWKPGPPLHQVLLKAVKQVAIPELQLSTWSNRGAETTAQNTHKSIRHALEQSPRLQGMTFDAFLQGSYRNATNVRADSDVDLVIMLTGTTRDQLGREHRIYCSELDGLRPDERSLYWSEHTVGTYDWGAFRTDVLGGLQDYYGADTIQEGTKAIKIAAAPGRLKADVVVALEYRLYRTYSSGDDPQNFVEGIWFRNLQSNSEIVNYPKQHFDNGAAKNATERTGERFKPVVRMFKNARGSLIDEQIISAGVAPSYFLQCLLYNVPNSRFTGSYQDMYTQIIAWLSRASLDTFVCQNGIVPLFGLEPEQWDTTSARSLISGLTRLWNEW